MACHLTLGKKVNTHVFQNVPIPKTITLKPKVHVTKCILVDFTRLLRKVDTFKKIQSQNNTHNID